MINLLTFKKLLLNNNYMVLISYNNINIYKYYLIKKLFSINNIYFLKLKSGLLYKIFGLNIRYNNILIFNNFKIFLIIFSKLKLYNYYKFNFFYYLNNNINLNIINNLLSFKYIENYLINLLIVLKKIIIKLIYILNILKNKNEC